MTEGKRRLRFRRGEPGDSEFARDEAILRKHDMTEREARARGLIR